MDNIMLYFKLMKGVRGVLPYVVQHHHGDINEVPTFMAPIPSETTHGIQIENPFNVMHPIIILYSLFQCENINLRRV